ncbi:hypothetical protein FRX31_029846 [Thalictrum thalictroides]|uniref:Uncharacterized protein n=1 Tax=Thalictrum thalictroides TaxID=46969 RepID=A0A7J6V7D6_THATH|nr:hypothetical protein FRX31_029846 [Thalictrum thalictroides]
MSCRFPSSNVLCLVSSNRSLISYIRLTFGNGYGFAQHGKPGIKEVGVTFQSTGHKLACRTSTIIVHLNRAEAGGNHIHHKHLSPEP